MIWEKLLLFRPQLCKFEYLSATIATSINKLKLLVENIIVVMNLKLII